MPTRRPRSTRSHEESRSLGTYQTRCAARAHPVGVPADVESVDLLADVDLDALALERAQARGKHWVEARFACVECHGRDFTGGSMVEDGAMGTWLGPNLTGGEGSPVANYAMADWDHIVRHGIKADGTPAIMPSEDVVNMSDQELSDIVAHIKSFAPVAGTTPAPTFGPISTMLMATGKLPPSAEGIADPHSALPPETGNTVEFGRHLSQVCTGCHRADLSGGPIAIGPPIWPPAANITPHQDGLEGWTYEQFVALMRDGERPDGSIVNAPMDLMMPHARAMTETELRALWTYAQSVDSKQLGI